VSAANPGPPASERKGAHVREPGQMGRAVWNEKWAENRFVGPGKLFSLFYLFFSCFLLFLTILNSNLNFEYKFQHCVKCTNSSFEWMTNIFLFTYFYPQNSYFLLFF